MEPQLMCLFQMVFLLFFQPSNILSSKPFLANLFRRYWPICLSLAYHIFTSFDKSIEDVNKEKYILQGV